jgi:HSP20 family protein
MLIRFDPFREFDRLVHQTGTAQRPAPMPLDAYRQGSRYVINFDLPGVNPDSVELTVEKNVLNVSAERSWAPEQGDEVLIAERPQGRYSRQLFLGDTLGTDGIEAQYDRGVLTVTIPVAESAKPRKVQVTSGEHRQTVTAGSHSDN